MSKNKPELPGYRKQDSVSFKNVKNKINLYSQHFYIVYVYDGWQYAKIKLSWNTTVHWVHYYICKFSLKSLFNHSQKINCSLPLITSIILWLLLLSCIFRHHNLRCFVLDSIYIAMKCQQCLAIVQTFVHNTSYTYHTCIQ